MKRIHQIKTFEDACKAINIDSNKLPVVDMIPEKHQMALISHYKLIIIAMALNEGWEPDWSNTAEYKYFPWFGIEANSANKSGVGFSGTHYVYWDAYTTVGSRLCFKSRELAIYAGTQFAELYQQYFLIK